MNKETKPWLLWILLIFLPPVGIIYMWVVKKDFTFQKKGVLSVIFTIWFISIIGGGDNTEDVSKNISENSASNMPVSQETEKALPSPTDFQQNADLVLITQSNHPMLFSSTDDAHVFWGDEKGILGWKDRADKKISYPDTYSKSSGSGVDWGACILEMTGDMNFSPCNSDYIFGIHICFNRFEKPVDLKLDEALQLASSYLPHDTLKSYYKFNYSTSYKATKESGDNDCYYDISYSPINKERCDFILNNNHSYSYPTINIILRENNKKYVTDIWIDLHQSMCRSGRHSIAYGGNYKEVKWDYDFLTK